MGILKCVIRICAVILSWGFASSSALAATIGINGGILTAFADGGDDALVVTSSVTDLTFSGVSFTIVTPGCGGAVVSCALAGLTEVRINMLGGKDVVDMSGVAAIPGISFIVLGSDGDDVLIGGQSANMMYGGLGDDVLIGATGVSNCLSGGTGNNMVIGSNCVAGLDPVFSPARPINVPEPAAWLLMLTGFGTLAWARQRLRTHYARPCSIHAMTKAD